MDLTTTTPVHLTQSAVAQQASTLNLSNDDMNRLLCGIEQAVRTDMVAYNEDFWVQVDLPSQSLDCNVYDASVDECEDTPCGFNILVYKTKTTSDNLTITDTSEVAISLFAPVDVMLRVIHH